MREKWRGLMKAASELWYFTVLAEYRQKEEILIEQPEKLISQKSQDGKYYGLVENKDLFGFATDAEN